MNITYANIVSVEDYTLLRASAGWRAIHPEQAKAGIDGSAFIIAAVDGQKTVGVARLVWDGGGYGALIKDALVLPDYRGKGIGKEIMKKARRYYKNETY